MSDQLRESLLLRGNKRLLEFCLANMLKVPEIKVIPKSDWMFDPCAYYRSHNNYGRIYICLEKCALPCGEARCRNWNWPGSATDRTPYGVIAHELAHHADRENGENKGTYWSEYGEYVRKDSGEKPITSYCPNDAEWFAECFRLYITNSALLKAMRPRTWKILAAEWSSVSSFDWVNELGAGVPARVIDTLTKKVVK